MNQLGSHLVSKRILNLIRNSISNSYRRPVSQTELRCFSSGVDGGVEIPFHNPDLQPIEKTRSESPQDEKLLDRFKLGFENLDCTTEKPHPESRPESRPETPKEIFKKMKETGLIPNAVAMLDGLCKDGLVKEAMKLFGEMREKGTIPEVVVYTAVVDGFCKARKLDEAVRIFRKMESNGIRPNAFSYNLLVLGLVGDKRSEEGLGFCLAMLEAGHSPNVASFVGLVQGLCDEKGAEEAKRAVGKLRERGFVMNDKAVREFLDKNAGFSPAVWEAVFEKKQRLF